MKRILFATMIAGLTISCNNSAQKDKEAAQQYTMDSLKQEIAKQRLIDSMNNIALIKEQEEQEERQAQEQRKAEQRAAARSSANRSGSYAAHRSDNSSSPTVIYQEAPPAEPKKKGWNAKVTGAIIGAGAGAITGAAVSKKKGTGAIIGGASGAAIGLGTGAIIDANKKKKEQNTTR